MWFSTSIGGTLQDAPAKTAVHPWKSWHLDSTFLFGTLPLLRTDVSWSEANSETFRDPSQNPKRWNSRILFQPRNPQKTLAKHQGQPFQMTLFGQNTSNTEKTSLFSLSHAGCSSPQGGLGGKIGVLWRQKEMSDDWLVDNQDDSIFILYYCYGLTIQITYIWSNRTYSFFLTVHLFSECNLQS